MQQRPNMLLIFKSIKKKKTGNPIEQKAMNSFGGFTEKEIQIANIHVLKSSV